MLVYKQPCSSPTITADSGELSTIDIAYGYYRSNFLILQSSTKGGLQ